MLGTTKQRIVLDLPADESLLTAYRSGDRGAIWQSLRTYLGFPHPVIAGAVPDDLQYPSLDYQLVPGDDMPLPPELLQLAPERLLYVLFADPDQVPGLVANLPRDARAFQDLPIDSFDNWCPSSDWPAFFATRARADALIRAEELARLGLRGRDVNVVMVDQGLSRTRLQQLFPGVSLGFGVTTSVGETQPFKAKPDGHGTMVARNVLSLAPEARLFDVALLPPQIDDVKGYISRALGWLYLVRFIVSVSKGLNLYPGPWVFCNAWGIYDSRTDGGPHPYTTDPNNSYNLAVTAIDMDGHDQVFAAGNGGQFCPVWRCGPDDRGWGRSILGANSHPHVLTVGAARADGVWIGYSSQGPGQPLFLPLQGHGNLVEKPDISAPSQFVEPEDSRALNSGTSAACGLGVGAIAALRSGAPGSALATCAMRDLLRRTASPRGGPWEPRLGYGILDLGEAVNNLSAKAPATS